MNYPGGVLSLKELKEGIQDLKYMILEIKKENDKQNERLQRIEEYLGIVND